jgi:uncharacterized protein
MIVYTESKGQCAPPVGTGKGKCDGTPISFTTEHTAMAEDDPSRLFTNAAFEWDENKRRLNVVKHGIDFADAKQVFYDPAAYTSVSPRSIRERRYVIVGSMRGALIAVIFTLRDQAIRIISARAARRIERQTYGAETKKEKPGSFGQ